MPSRPKLLFVYDHPRPEWWMDGLWVALEVLADDFEISRLNLSPTLPKGHPESSGEVSLLGDANSKSNYDFVLGWGAFGSRPDLAVRGQRLAKCGLCIAGNATPPEGANSYDVLFYESKWYRPQINFHPNIVHAFGINSDLYSPPSISTPVVWDYIGVGAFASWKRWEKMKDKKGSRLVVGEYQESNESESLEIARDLIRGGVMVSNQVNPYDLVNLYHWSRTLYMPSNVYGGGERALLEAKACGLKVEIEGDNPKLQELVDLDVVPNHLYYAAQLKKGILSCLKS